MRQSMLDLANGPELKQYKKTFYTGETLFLEGDKSTDLYILLSGKLDIIKGEKKISEMSEPGLLFGEMSYLLGHKRTATIKAVSEVETVMIPGEKMDRVMKDFPALGPEIAKELAQRLTETSNMVHGLKEFCDQLPDAVMITTDKDQKILAWNAAAERLYGRGPDEMKDLPLKEIYEDPTAYEEFQHELEDGACASNTTLLAKNPAAGEPRYVSTSTTVLYDGHHNIQGLLFLGRDVTRLHMMEKKYRQVKNWLIPAVAMLGFLIIILVMAYPSFTKGTQILDHKKNSFKEKISTGHAMMVNNLVSPVQAKNFAFAEQFIKKYFEEDDPLMYGISGLLLLNPEKKVIMAYSPAGEGEAQNLLGSSYGAIDFVENSNSSHHLLTLFRASKDHPMGKKEVEIAFSMDTNGDQYWLIFQLDMEWLKREFGLDMKTLNHIKFE